MLKSYIHYYYYELLPRAGEVRRRSREVRRRSNQAKNAPSHERGAVHSSAPALDPGLELLKSRI